MHQTKKQLSHPNLHRHHIQGDVLQSIAKAIHQSPSPIHFHKFKSHRGIEGKEYADALARKSITAYSDVADTSIKTAGPEGNPFYYIYWLAKEYEKHEIIQIQQSSNPPQGSVTYPIITMTPLAYPCKHTCTPVTN
jgi:hypothetical protein